MTYAEWMHKVDLEVQAIAFVSVHDLTDYGFRDCYDDGYDPQEVALEVLEDNGFPINLLV